MSPEAPGEAESLGGRDGGPGVGGPPGTGLLRPQGMGRGGSPSGRMGTAVQQGGP